MKKTYWTAPIYDNYQISIDGLKAVVCDHFEIKLSDLTSKSRKREFVEARNIIAYVLIKNTSLGLREVAAHFNRSHCLMVHYVKTVEDLMEVDKRFKQLVNKFI